MTRQALLVFKGAPRSPGVSDVHESPSVMLVPLFVLAAGAVMLAIVGTPVWPWFEKWIEGGSPEFHFGALWAHGGLGLIVLSLVLVGVGVVVAWRLYRAPSSDSAAPDPLEAILGKGWGLLRDAMGFDAFYQRVVIAPLAFVAGGLDAFERMVMVPLMGVGEACCKWFGRCTGASDEAGLNKGFNGLCFGLRRRAASVSASQNGRPQGYLRPIGLGMATLLILYFWLKAR